MMEFLSENFEGILVGVISALVILIPAKLRQWASNSGKNSGKKERGRLSKWRDLLKSTESTTDRQDLINYIQLEILADQRSAQNTQFIFLCLSVFSLAGGILGLALNDTITFAFSSLGLLLAFLSMLLFSTRMIVEGKAQRVILEELRVELEKRHETELPGRKHGC